MSSIMSFLQAHYLQILGVIYLILRGIATLDPKIESNDVFEWIFKKIGLLTNQGNSSGS